MSMNATYFSLTDECLSQCVYERDIFLLTDASLHRGRPAPAVTRVRPVDRGVWEVEPCLTGQGQLLGAQEGRGHVGGDVGQSARR